MKTVSLHNWIAVALFATALFTVVAAPTSAQSVGDKVAATTDTVKTKVQDAGQTATDKLNRLWRQIDDERLKNRTRDEIVAWVIMGVVAGSILGRFTKLAWGTALGFGLIGAFLGGLIVHLTQFDMGFGPVLIRYEDLLSALIGAVVVLFVVRRVMKRKDGSPE